MVHGNTPEEVKQDSEGMQTMRTLGLNMAWLMKSIQAGWHVPNGNGLRCNEYERFYKVDGYESSCILTILYAGRIPIMVYLRTLCALCHCRYSK